MSRKTISLLAVFALSLSVSAFADDKGTKDAKKDGAGAEKDDAAADKGKKKASPGEKKDPKGITGISPFYEKFSKGEAFMAARDWGSAITAFKEAIAADSKNPAGHLALGAAQIEKGDLVEAEPSFQNALRDADTDPAAKAKALFSLADLKERAKKYEEAKAAWAEYAKHVTGNAKAKGFLDTPKERQKAIDTWLEVEKKAALVKERIAKREQEVKAEMEKAAKKDADANDKKPRK